MNFHRKWPFRFTETPESADSTKQYELLLQIGEIPTRNHFSTWNPLFSGIHTFREGTISARKWFSGRETAFPRREGAGKTNLGYVLQL